MGIFDISPLVSEQTAVFPGDQEYKRLVSMEFPRDHLCLSSIQTTLHIGAHADAPSHYAPNGQSIDARSLDLYLGPCQVLSPKGSAPLVEPEELGPILAPRVLLRTLSFPNPNYFARDFRAIAPATMQSLAAKGVFLVGIDTPSIDLWDDQILACHKLAYQHDFAILEGLVLDQVPDGLYELIALPLNLKGADASPVRAILRELPGQKG